MNLKNPIMTMEGKVNEHDLGISINGFGNLDLRTNR